MNSHAQYPTQREGPVPLDARVIGWLTGCTTSLPECWQAGGEAVPFFVVSFDRPGTPTFPDSTSRVHKRVTRIAYYPVG